MSKPGKIAMFGSLLLNALLIGTLIGSMSDRLFRKEFPLRKPPEFGIKLPADKEKVFSDAMAKVFQQNEEMRKQIDDARERVLSVLSAPEFDQAAYRVETARLEKLRSAMMQRFADATEEIAKQFNQEERKVLAEHLRQPPPPPPSQKDPFPKPGPPPGREGLPPGRMP